MVHNRFPHFNAFGNGFENELRIFQIVVKFTCLKDIEKQKVVFSMQSA